jgi:hypothetical protein
MSSTDAAFRWYPGRMALLLAALGAVALLLRTPGEWFDWIWPAAFGTGAAINAVTWWRSREHRTE